MKHAASLIAGIVALFGCERVDEPKSVPAAVVPVTINSVDGMTAELHAVWRNDPPPR